MHRERPRTPDPDRVTCGKYPIGRLAKTQRGDRVKRRERRLQMFWHRRKRRGGQKDGDDRQEEAAAHASQIGGVGPPKQDQPRAKCFGAEVDKRTRPWPAASRASSYRY